MGRRTRMIGTRHSVRVVCKLLSNRLGTTLAPAQRLASRIQRSVPNVALIIRKRAWTISCHVCPKVKVEDPNTDELLISVALLIASVRSWGMRPSSYNVLNAHVCVSCVGDYNLKMTEIGSLADYS